MQFETIQELVERQGECRGDAYALEDTGGKFFTYIELAAKVRRLMGALTAAGVTRDSRVAIVMPNCADWGLGVLGVCATAIASPLSPVFRADEFRVYFDTLRTEFLMVLAGDDNIARQAAQEAGITVLELAADGSLAASGSGRVVQNLAERARESDLAAILLTSGSTGKQKKVPLTHHNLIAAARLISRLTGLAADDRFLSVLGSGDITALVTRFLAPLVAGASVIFDPDFQPSGFLSLVREHSPTCTYSVPAILRELVHHAEKDPISAKNTSLQSINSGGAVVSQRLISDVESMLGARVAQGYGMTEVGARLTTRPLPPAPNKVASVGVPSGVELRIVASDGSDVARGEIGEVVARGDSVFAGYEDDPDANAETFVDGWYRTGDLGYLDDDGYLFLKGRLRQMINRGGEKVNPQEVDDVLMTHPAVAHTGTFGTIHRTLGEDVAAAVVLAPEAHVGEAELRAYVAELRAYVAERLSPFKVPYRIVFLSRMPLGQTGKIDRLTLSEMAAAWG